MGWRFQGMDGGSLGLLPAHSLPVPLPPLAFWSSYDSSTGTSTVSNTLINCGYKPTWEANQHLSNWPIRLRSLRWSVAPLDQGFPSGGPGAPWVLWTWMGEKNAPFLSLTSQMQHSFSYECRWHSRVVVSAPVPLSPTLITDISTSHHSRSRILKIAFLFIPTSKFQPVWVTSQILHLLC